MGDAPTTALPGRPRPELNAPGEHVGVDPRPHPVRRPRAPRISRGLRRAVREVRAHPRKVHPRPVPRPGLATWRQPGGSGRGRRDLLADRTKADWRFGPRTNQRVRHLVGGSARHLARRPTWSRRFPCVPKNLRPSTVAGTPSREAGCAPNPTSSRVDRRRRPPGLPPCWMPRLNRTRRMPRGCRIVPAPLRAEPSPGMSDRPRMPTTGSRPAGGPGPAARDGPPRSSGGEGLDSSRVNPDRPRTPRTGRRSPHRRWEAQAQSSPPIIPADLNALTATLRVPLACQRAHDGEQSAGGCVGDEALEFP